MGILNEITYWINYISYSFLSIISKPVKSMIATHPLKSGQRVVSWTSGPLQFSHPLSWDISDQYMLLCLFDQFDELDLQTEFDVLDYKNYCNKQQ